MPSFLIALYFYSSANEIEDAKLRIEAVSNQAFIKNQKQATNQAVRKHFAESDRFYIDKNLENITFLETEIEGLQKIAENKSVAEDESFKKRLDLLSKGNRLSFIESNVTSYPIFQETTETLAHPVEVNLEDIKEILAKVEGLQIGKYKPGPNPPQLLILDFRIDKQAQSEDNEIYLLNLKLLKREYL